MLKTFIKFSWIVALLLSACDKQDNIQAEIRLSPEPATIDYNGTFTLSWTTTAVDYCIASGDWSGSIKTRGSKTLGPLTRDSIYLLSCFHSGKEISESVTVKVRAAEIPVVKLTASPLSIGFREPTTISWTSQHVAECSATGDWSGNKELNGSLKLEGLETDSEFGLTCSGPKGVVSNSVSLNVFEAGITVPRVKLTATPATISYNGSTTLSWNSQNADICRASGNWFGSKARSGEQTIKQLNRDSHFMLTCTIAGGGGAEGVDVAEVRVNPAPPPTVTLTAIPAEVSSNSSTTLRWSSSHANSCIATGDWSGTKSVSGTLTINELRKDSLFKLSCTGVGGLASDSIKITLKDGST